MKKVLTYILTLIVFSATLASCADDTFNDSQVAEGKVSLRLLLSLPGGDSQTRATDNIQDVERKINDLHVLIFDQNGILQEEVMNITSSDEQNGVKMLNAITEKSYKNKIEVAILTNVGKSKGDFNNGQYLGQTKSAIYQSLTYDYSSAWDITRQAIPMWGASFLVPRTNINTLTVSLYRAIAKINVYDQQKEGEKNFTLTSVRVYYSYDKGYSIPTVEPTAPSPVTQPSIAAEFNRFDTTKPLAYIHSEGTTAVENMIYVPETNNKSLTQGEKALCLVVGGKYTGTGLVESGKDSYYRIDLKDRDTQEAYDVLRNHLYKFNINSVNSPGTSTPEDALENAVVGMDVTIEAWDETVLRSIADQYSLVTDKSRVSFKQEGGSEAVTVWSDFGEQWEVVDKNDEWFSYTIENGKIILQTKPNYGASRTGYFYVKVGQLKKQIIVEQSQPGTANCYLVGEGEHEISVIVKGNGTQGLHADDKNGTRVVLDQTAILPTHHLSIIWETKKGLVQLKDHQSGGYVTNNAGYDTVTGRLQYKVNPVGASIGGEEGGNALIGAFDENNRLIWSWHIWVCPEMAQTGYQDENWTLTGYNVMDRNLGALSNQPGIASLGLLYQWGRKDPFIGAAEIKDNSSVLHTENYMGYNWDVAANESNEVDYTIEHPTQLIHHGLSQSSAKGAYLWGTNGGLNKDGIKDLGTKTIYDPCPVGYRIPPVDAFVFKGTVIYEDRAGSDPNFNESDLVKKEYSIGTFTENITTVSFWVSGAIYLRYEGEAEATFYPNGVTVKTNIRYWIARRNTTYTLRKSSEDKNWNENLIYIPNNATGILHWDPINLMHHLSGPYLKNATQYGYYMNYKEIKQPEVEGLYNVKFGQQNLTWIPLSGAYDPTKGFGFDGVTIQQGPSLTVNSFLWTNSSIQSTDGVTRPAALFLHGAELKGGNDGRHVHGLNKEDIKAEPHYAGAIRCVRDIKKDFSADNKVPGDINFDSTAGTIIGKIYAINDSWRVVDPGAPWFRITPDQAVADKNKGRDISFIAESNRTGRERTATVKIQFIGEQTPRTVKVTQKANN